DRSARRRRGALQQREPVDAPGGRGARERTARPGDRAARAREGVLPRRAARRPGAMGRALQPRARAAPAARPRRAGRCTGRAAAEPRTRRDDDARLLAGVAMSVVAQWAAQVARRLAANWREHADRWLLGGAALALVACLLDPRWPAERARFDHVI